MEWRNNLLERVGQTRTDWEKNRQLLMQLNWRDVSFHEIRLYGRRITKPYATSKVTFPSEKKKSLLWFQFDLVQLGT